VTDEPLLVEDVTPPAPGAFRAGQQVTFTVTLSEAVIVGGTPQIGLTALTAARQATYVSGSGTESLTFRYVVQAGDTLGRKKTLGLAKSIALPSGASISDEAGNRAVLTISAPSLKGIRIDTATVAAATLSAGGDVTSGEVLVRGLSMPHSPRLSRGVPWLLNSGHGRLERYDSSTRTSVPVATLPGYTRGLDLCGGLAFVGLSRVRETAVFGGLPLDDRRDELRCGVAAVDCQSGQVVATLFFTSGVEEIFDVRVVPGYRNPVVSGPYPDVDETETIWLVPAPRPNAGRVGQPGP
jgi:hypothetical protein